MYNSSSPEDIPLFIPIAPAALLRTWFDNQTLDKGLELLRQGKVAQFFIYRNGAACMVGESPVHVLFEQAKQIPAGFTLRQEHCGICGFRKNNKPCAHLAALCILSLHEKGPGSLAPLPLTFKDSAWGQLTVFLYNWLGKEKGLIEVSSGEQTVTCRKQTSTGTFSAVITQKTTAATALLSPDTPQPVHSQLAEIQELCLSKNERLLLKAGSSSIGLQQDGSVWNRLCGLAHCLEPNTVPDISYSTATGCFMLTTGSETRDVRLTAQLPPAKTFEILDAFGLIGNTIRLLSPGRPGSDVYLDTQGRIVVSPLVWLAEDRALRLSELHRQKFGSYYYLADAGFFRMAAETKEAKITVADNAQQMPSLFDFLKKDDEIVVEPGDIANFLERNGKQLRHPDNRVDPQVLAIRVIHLPDKLIIHDIQEGDGSILLACEFGIDDTRLALSQLSKALQQRKPLRFGLTTFAPQEGPLDWLYKAFSKNVFSVSDDMDGVRLTRGEFAFLLASIPQVEHRGDNSGLQQMLVRLSSSKQTTRNSALHFREYLRDYQRDGLSWLFTLYKLGLGGILADDMGLGKTHQALALIETALRQATVPLPILIVCPASVLLHWADKINRFYPDLRYALYYGPNRDLQAALAEQVIITTYAITRVDRELLTEYRFELIIFDEIQTLKNRNTATYQANRAIRTRVAFGLSGTPIENSLEDLFSLFSICLPGFFGPFESFKRNFLNPIENYRSARQESLLTQKIHPFILRRSRTQVLSELPEMIEDTLSCELSDVQLQLYEATIAAQQPLLSELADEDAAIDYLHVFAMLNRLKQICNHPSLLEKSKNPNTFTSGKWDLFVELLDECLENGRKVVVFSQYLGMLDLFAHHLTDRNIGFASLRGNMNPAKRQAMIDRFAADDDCRVFTASLLAGGTGIDLVAGKAVIHYDRWWNPAKEDQATARVHRMGQKDVVHLFQLITANTLEEKIDAIISGKKQLSQAIIKEDELGLIKQLSRQELLALFNV